MKIRRTAPLFLACTLVGGMATGSVAAAEAPTVPEMNCPQPAPLPEKGVSTQQVDAYNKALPEYRQCVQTYVDARTADAKRYSELTQANNKAAEAAVAEFNRFAKQVSGGKPAAAASTAP